MCVPIVNDLLQLPVAHCVEKTNGDKTEENSERGREEGREERGSGW